MAELTAAAGERRQVTVLFADMVGFTSMAERLGEEGTYALIRSIYDLMVGAVREEGGSVHQFVGDGIMALFGAPIALEDAPLRACRAALLIHQRLASAAPEIEARHGSRPQMRIGINTGLAVITTMGGGSANATALGDAVNLASRLQGLADPGAVLLSEGTHRLVEGLVDASFSGAHSIRGKAETQKVYRLESIRKGVTRFLVEIGRGLSPYVGRAKELETLDLCFREGFRRLRVIDVMGEPGMGKSRLVHEFCQRVGKQRAFVLSGSCSSDGRQTPFLPFIEIVRGAFRVRTGEDEDELTRKLDAGLVMLELHSRQNLGLLLNLLGLEPPEGSLAGLDGVLIGLRMRDLLQKCLEARCRLSPVVMVIEDLHWIDNASEEMLRRFVGEATELPLLIVHTRRPDYKPAWCDQQLVTTLRLQPLAASYIQHLFRARLGAEALPEAIAEHIMEKAEGNPLFAEEIAGLLKERGMLEGAAGNADFDMGAMIDVLPANLQNLLSQRIDRLAPRDRALLQAASVIGRRFDSRLLAAAAGDASDIDSRLAAMEAFGLVGAEGNSGSYAFRHALVRDALYQTLLTGPRASLHLRIAEALEQRSANRLLEVTEVLSHHYGQTDRTDKAFTYAAMAAAKSLRIYSLDEASTHIASAIALLDRNPQCATDRQVGEWLIDATVLFKMLLRSSSATEIVERYMPRINRLGDSPTCILVRHHYLSVLILSGRFRDAEKVLVDLAEMAKRLDDARSTLYALASDLHLSIFVAPKPYGDFVTLGRRAIVAANDMNDVYLCYYIQFAIAWDEMHRGHSVMARAAAEHLVASGRQLGDPRLMGLGLGVQAWGALANDDYPAALELADTCLRNARTILEREGANLVRNSALVLLGAPGAIPALRAWMNTCTANGWRWVSNGSEGIWGVALVAGGEVGAGLRWMAQSISSREQDGYHAAADWYRLNLCEIYLAIISRRQKPSAMALLRNALTLLTVTLTAEKRIIALVTRVRANAQFDPDGHFICRCEMILGLLYTAKRKPAQALRHLTEAKRIACPLGPTPMLARIEAALAQV